jgi:hypothetical protein
LKDNWTQQPAYIRFMSWLSYGAVRMLMGMAGYPRENIGDKNERTPELDE